MNRHKTVKSYLQKCLFLFQVLANHRCHVIRFRVWAQFVSSSAPVFFPLIFLLQAFQHTAHLPIKRGSAESSVPSGGGERPQPMKMGAVPLKPVTRFYSFLRNHTPATRASTALHILGILNSSPCEQRMPPYCQFIVEVNSATLGFFNYYYFYWF